MSKYTILDNGMGEFEVKEKTRTHTGVRWITLENTIDSFDSLEKAKEKQKGGYFFNKTEGFNAALGTRIELRSIEALKMLKNR